MLCSSLCPSALSSFYFWITRQSCLKTPLCSTLTGIRGKHSSCSWTWANTRLGSPTHRTGGHLVSTRGHFVFSSLIETLLALSSIWGGIACSLWSRPWLKHSSCAWVRIYILYFTSCQKPGFVCEGGSQVKNICSSTDRKDSIQTDVLRDSPVPPSNGSTSTA